MLRIHLNLENFVNPTPDWLNLIAEWTDDYRNGNVTA